MAFNEDQFQTAVKAVEEVLSERTIKWSNDPFGRVARTKDLIDQHDASYESLAIVTDALEKLVSEAARQGYAKLEQSVNTLMRLEHGNTRLSREDASILNALHATVDYFQEVCTTSQNATTNISLECERCMRLGDNAAQYLNVLASQIPLRALSQTPCISRLHWGTIVRVTIREIQIAYGEIVIYNRIFQRLHDIKIRIKNLE
ncbi:hypothetical protein N7520_005316 [Penicillium odoratum]|uniref:uncharacterized protein n=1 Tax=Penicillium odoratum TaxID=1167516 RepID=UPI002547F6AC|nr:uncharacterized protein N7520_005316 [Penicillium odoratum]KAJ5765757.1 hypothetical protein N7520_005316 [Penicillium odoratum]